MIFCLLVISSHGTEADDFVTMPVHWLEVGVQGCALVGLLLVLTPLVSWQMLLVGSTRYFARGMELGIHRDPADRIFILVKVMSLKWIS